MEKPTSKPTAKIKKATTEVILDIENTSDKKHKGLVKTTEEALPNIDGGIAPETTGKIIDRNSDAIIVENLTGDGGIKQAEKKVKRKEKAKADKKDKTKEKEKSKKDKGKAKAKEKKKKKAVKKLKAKAKSKAKSNKKKK